MDPHEEKVIPFDRGKLFRLLIGASVFVCGGLWILIFGPPFPNPDGVAFQRAVSAAAVIFFGLGVYLALSKLTSGKPGLVLNRNGVYDNSSAASLGLVPWRQIADIRTYQANRRNLVLIELRDEAKLSSNAGAFSRFMLSRNLKRCGAHIVISTHVLNLKSSDILAALLSYKLKFGAP